MPLDDDLFPDSTPPTPWRTATLLLPRIRVQNANAISSPLTWGFPAITAFTGLMVALERRLGVEAGLRLQSVGVVCHRFEAQTHQGSRFAAHTFKLSRNPVGADGGTAAIVEEGRAHLEVSLVFQAQVHSRHATTEQLALLAQQALDALFSLRVAGGSPLPPTRLSKRQQPWLTDAAPDGDTLKTLKRRLLPGFALVLRDDLLQARWAELRAADPSKTQLDAWLSLCALRWRAPGDGPPEPDASGKPPPLDWQLDARPAGWLVPIPVGFAGLTPLQAPGQVANSRDASLPQRFVESIWSIGQWVSPHRIGSLQDLLWHPEADDLDGFGRYRCRNAFSVSATSIHV